MSGYRPRPISERFWEKVRKSKPNDCWEWMGQRRVDGYGVIFGGPGANNRRLKAHRVSWEIANGTNVPDGLWVLHHCDNPPCVNPEHLYVGTVSENSRDRAARKRGKENRQCGALNDNAKLRWSQVEAIRKQHATGKWTQ